MRILITGINGFAGSHLARYLLTKKDIELYGTVRVRSDLHRIEDIKNCCNLRLIELTDSVSINNIIQSIKPQQIYHLAAQSYVKSSWDSPLETYQTNVMGTVSLFEAVKLLELECRILVTSTSEVYGSQSGIITELTPPTPNTHYGISKYAQDQIARLYHKAFNMDVVVTRSFNITGAGRADVFVDSNFTKQIAVLEKERYVLNTKTDKDLILKHGYLETKRDFTDVKDVVKAYVLVMNRGNKGEIYCICQEQSTKISDLLDIMIKLSIADIKTEIDPERFRPVDTLMMIGDCSKLRTELGWKPEIPLVQSMEELLNYWRKKV